MRYSTALIFFAFLLLFARPVCAQNPTPLPKKLPELAEYPKNIILLIGDGMGLTQISAALYSNSNQLNLERFPVTGLMKTHSYDHLVTDSAAGATAFATGEKTYNNAIGVNKDTLRVKTILQEASEKGLATGLIATSTIVHATPAAFIAHAASRESYEDIAASMIETPVDLLIGGGKRYFDQREYDTRNLVKELRTKGYVVEDFNRYHLGQFRMDASKRLVYFTADKHPAGIAAGRDYLALASRLGAYFLEKRSEKGFFLMIEGSQIDWACHQRDGRTAILETLDFDRSIGEILKYAQEKQNTLVIVTADHETGGMAIMPGSKMNKPTLAFTTNNHTATVVPVFAFGPGAELFSGIFDNTDLYHKMRWALGLNQQKTTPAPIAPSDSVRTEKE